MSAEPATVDTALKSAALEYEAEAAREGAATRKAVEQLHAATEAAASAGDVTHEQLAGLLIGVACLFTPSLDKRLTYSEAEQEKIAAAAVPVLKKYFPDGGLPCELVFIGALAVITAPKLLPARGGAQDGGSESAAVAPAPEERAAA